MRRNTHQCPNHFQLAEPSIIYQEVCGTLARKTSLDIANEAKKQMDLMINPKLLTNCDKTLCISAFCLCLEYNIYTIDASNGAVSTSANLGVYSNSACTTPLSSISWGNLTAGGNITQTIYVKNTGSGLSLALSMATSNWTPTTANGPITLTWNQEGTRLNPGQSVAATLTLTVSSTIADVTNFSVQITITGTN
jgi:hypothetical protein